MKVNGVWRQASCEEFHTEYPFPYILLYIFSNGYNKNEEMLE